MNVTHGIASEHERETGSAPEKGEEWFEQIFRHSPDPVSLLGDDGLILDANDAACALTGYARDVMVGQSATGLCGLPDSDHGLLSVIQSGDGKASALLATRSGQAIPVELAWRSLQWGGRRVTLLSARDNTEAQQALEALKASEQQYRALYSMTRLMCDNVPDLIWAKDLQKNYLFANRAICDQLLNAADTSEPLGRNDLFFATRERESHPDDPRWHTFGEICRDSDAVVMTTRRAERFDEFGEVQGRFLFLDVHKAPFIDDRSEMIGTVGCARDVTANRATAQQLQRRNRELQLLNDIARAGASSLELEPMLAVMLDAMRRHLLASHCAVWLVDADTGELVCRQASGNGANRMRGYRLPSGLGVGGWVLEHDCPVFVPDLAADARWTFPEMNAQGFAGHTMLCVPMRHASRALGVLHVMSDVPGRLTGDDESVVTSAAAAAAMAVDNVELFEQVRRDADTKASLLREVNHRVQNNLTAIIGLLEAQRRTVGGDQPLVHRLLRDLGGRIRSLAVAHRLLSASEWGCLSLDDLCRQVIGAAVQAVPDGRMLTVDVGSGVARVSPAQSHHLALVINELATNAVKHALGDRWSAGVRVRFETEGAFQRLEFRDDGPGFSAEALEGRHNRFGLDLVRNIVCRTARWHVQSRQ